LIVIVDKGGCWSFIYILVFTYYTLLHLSLHLFSSPRDWAKYIYI
jgi:hypothetical protein